MNDRRISILKGALRELGVPAEEVDACLQGAEGLDDRQKCRRLLSQLEARGTLPEENLKDLRLAFQFSDEASAIFLRAHLEKKPVVLLLKGLEEVFKTEAPAAVVELPAQAGPPQVGASGESSLPELTPAPPTREPVIPPRPGGNEIDDDHSESKTRPLEAVESSSKEEEDRREEGPPYEVIRRLGTGRLTQAYKARDRLRDRFVVVKYFPRGWSKKRDFIEKLFDNARQTMGFEHPRLARMKHIVIADRECYVVTEFVEGANLKTLLAGGRRLPVDRALSILGQVSAALEAAHGAGLCHGSIHPGNVVMQPSGEIKLLDLGLGAISDIETGPELSEGARLYQLHYRSPERHGYLQPPTPASDIYELGILLYEMLAGKQPFDAQEPDRLAHLHASEPLPDLPRGLRPLDSSLGELLRKMTAKSPEDRPRRVRAIREKIREIQGILPTLELDENTEDTTSQMIAAEIERDFVSVTRKRRLGTGRSPTPGGPAYTAFTLVIVLLVLALVFVLARRGAVPSPPRGLGDLVANLSVHGRIDSDIANKIIAFGDQALPVLLREIRSADRSKHLPAFETLVGIGTPESKQATLGLARHPDPTIRGGVLIALAKWNRLEALDYIRRALEKEDAEVRRQAMMALGQYEGQEARALLEEGLKDEDISVRKQAELSLQKLAGARQGS